MFRKKATKKDNGAIMERYTFKKTERLSKSWEFQRIRTEGIKKTGRYLILYILNGQPSRKIGIIASKRLGNSPQRARAKRLLREAFRLNKYKLPDSLHIVVIPKKSVLGLKLKDIEGDFLRLLKE